MNDTIRGLFHKIDTAPHGERVGLFIGSLPVIADAYRDAGNDARADFATWLYKVIYLEKHGVRVRCEPAMIREPVRGKPVLPRDLQPCTLYGFPCVTDDEGPALWNVEGLQPAAWRTLGTERRWLNAWPKKNVSAFNLFVRLFAWAKPVLHLLTGETRDH